MRALTMDEVGFVSGGTTPNNNSDCPTYIPPSGPGELGLFSNIGKWLKGCLDSVIDGLPDGLGWFDSKTGGDGPCYDSDGNVVRNANGDPLLKCVSNTGGVHFTWGH